MVSYTMPKEPVLYEAMYIVQSALPEEAVAELEERLRAGLESEGAVVESVHEFGRRRLAYPIKGHNDGVYRIMYFRGMGAAVDEIKHEFALSEEVIRGTVVVANPKFMIGQRAAAEEPQAEAAASQAEAGVETEAQAEAIVEAAVEAETEAPTQPEAGTQEAAAEAPAVPAADEAAPIDTPEEPAAEQAE